MRAIHGVCNRWDQAFDFTAGLPSFRRVQSQAPSLIVELIDCLSPPPSPHKNNKRPGREKEGSGGSKILDGEGLSWGPGGRTSVTFAMLHQLQLPPPKRPYPNRKRKLTPCFRPCLSFACSH